MGRWLKHLAANQEVAQSLRPGANSGNLSLLCVVRVVCICCVNPVLRGPVRNVHHAQEPGKCLFWYYQFLLSRMVADCLCSSLPLLQASFVYQFQPSESFYARAFGLTMNIYYRDLVSGPCKLTHVIAHLLLEPRQVALQNQRFDSKTLDSNVYEHSTVPGAVFPMSWE